MTYRLEDAAWYCVVTLRDSCLAAHLATVRKFYPTIPIYVIDNNDGRYSIDAIAAAHNATVLKHQGIKPLTTNQTEYSLQLFQQHKLLCFSSDDIEVLEGGFIELAIERINQGSEIVSFSTDADPVAYMYTEQFFRELGFNTALLGKEMTDRDLIKRCQARYGKLDSVGEYWREDRANWYSRYVKNPRVGEAGKNCVNQALSEIGIESGVYLNAQHI